MERETKTMWLLVGSQAFPRVVPRKMIGCGNMWHAVGDETRPVFYRLGDGVIFSNERDALMAAHEGLDILRRATIDNITRIDKRLRQLSDDEKGI